MVEWSGRTSLHKHKFDSWEKSPVEPTDSPGVKTVRFLDAQWSTCPVEVEDQVKDLWRFNDLGNDRYMLEMSINDLVELEESKVLVEQWKSMPDGWVKGPIKTDAVVQYLREQGATDDEPIIIHWWW